jgi:hypothetical protein
METNMQYKTIVLELLQRRPKIHDQLRKERKLLLTMERYAKELKTSHQAWMELLCDLRPDSDRSQLSSEALEIALKELEDRLSAESAPDETANQFLDAAMLFTRNRRTPRG